MCRADFQESQLESNKELETFIIDQIGLKTYNLRQLDAQAEAHKQLADRKDREHREGRRRTMLQNFEQN